MFGNFDVFPDFIHIKQYRVALPRATQYPSKRSWGNIEFQSQQKKFLGSDLFKVPFPLKTQNIMEPSLCNGAQCRHATSKDFFTNIFDTTDWPARWYCGNWSDFHGWLYIISDLLISAAYFTIPVMLIYFIRKKTGVPFQRIFWLFGAFIVLCGSTHLFDAIIFYYPLYRVNAILLLVTAIASWMTIVALYRVIPNALLLRTPAQLELIVKERTLEVSQINTELKLKADQLKHSYEDLETKVKFRTLELEKTIIKLQTEIASLKK